MYNSKWPSLSTEIIRLTGKIEHKISTNAPTFCSSVIRLSCKQYNALIHVYFIEKNQTGRLGGLETGKGQVDNVLGPLVQVQGHGAGSLAKSQMIQGQ